MWHMPLKKLRRAYEGRVPTPYINSKNLKFKNSKKKLEKFTWKRGRGNFIRKKGKGSLYIEIRVKGFRKIQKQLPKVYIITNILLRY